MNHEFSIKRHNAPDTHTTKFKKYILLTFKDKYISGLVRIGSIINFDLSSYKNS